MRALDIAFFIICFNLAIPLVAMTGIFGAGPGGTSDIVEWAYLTTLITIVSTGGISIMGWSFKTPAVITAFAAFYTMSVNGMNVLIYQIIQPAHVAAVFVGLFTALAIIVGVRGVLQLAGGAFGPME